MTIVWFIVAVGFDVAAWSALRLVSALAENPGSASALALCWVHVFILPPLLARPWCGLLRLILTASIGVAAAAIALAAGFVAGLQVGSMALLIGFAFYGPYTGAYHEPPGPLLQTVQGVLGDIMLWSGPAAGSAISLIAAVGLAAIKPGLQRPRLSWWLVDLRRLGLDRVPAGLADPFSSNPMARACLAGGSRGTEYSGSA